MSSSFTLREMRPGDSAALVRLGEESPDTGRVGMHSVFTHDAYQTLLAVHPSSIGVVAEAPDHDGIVGNGLVRFSEGQIEGKLCPTAYLSSLHVHPAYRRRGTASAIADWRIKTARERMGADGVIYAGIQAANDGSILTAKKWMTQSIPRTGLGVVKTRTQPPQPLSGVEVRPIRPEDYEEVALKQNQFYQDYNLYEPLTAESLKSWLAQTPFELPIYHYDVAVDSTGNILAGVGVIALGELIPAHVTRMPLPLRIVNLLLKITPADGVMKRVLAVHFWFGEGQTEAAAYLWESVRWHSREYGTTIMMFFDTAGSVAQTIHFPGYTRQPPGTLVFQSPVPLTESRLIDLYHISW